MAYMAGQSGGYGMLRFTKWDVYNYVHWQRVVQKLNDDAAATISYLEGKANADMRTMARYTRTPDNCLGSLFWADGEMMMDYQLFGDVLAFDSTYRSNKYKKPLVVFSGLNHHKQTSIFGFALLEDEEIRTYRWVLLNLLDVMGQKKPCVVVTDGDKAMRTAIAEVMPTVTHRLCGWHLEKNCVQRVKEAEFCKVFRKAIYANFEISEFDEYWKASVESLGLDDNNWVKCTYECRESWAMAYLRETFCAGYRTTSRCEGINAFIKGFLKSTDSILELMHSLDWVVKDYRNNELYTRAVFREVKKQIKGVATLLFRGKDSIGMTTVYTFSRMGKPNKTHKVLIDPNEEKIECECSMWNSEGIPCSHIFCAMKYEGLEEIPPGLILRRWCKEAKDRRSTPVDSKDGPEGHLLRYGALCGAMSLVAQLGAEDAAEFVVARDRMRLPVSPKRFSGEGFTGLGANSVYHRWPGSRTPWYQRQRGHPGRERSPNRLVRVTGCRRDDVVPTVRLRVTRRGLARGTGERVLQGLMVQAVQVTWSMVHIIQLPLTQRHRPVIVTQTSWSSTTLRYNLDCFLTAYKYCVILVEENSTKLEGLQPDNGNPGDTPPAQPDGTTPSIAHGCSSPFCRNPVGVGGARANFFLGGQHIEQFYTTKSCSGHIAQPSTQAANPSFGNLNAWTNKDLFERWLRQTAVGRMAGTRKPGSVPKQ
ncbi:hypothetical protein AHAS_Ahas13G0146100 [Arachis hypogaea]